MTSPKQLLLTIFLLLLAFWPAKLASQEIIQPLGTKEPCFAIGDTVTMTGKFFYANGDILFAPQAFPPRRYCALYYNAWMAMGAVGPEHELHGLSVLPESVNIPLNVLNSWVEVTGLLSLPRTSGPVLTIRSFKNMGDLIDRYMTAWKQECKQWQDQTISEVPNRKPQNSDNRTAIDGTECSVTITIQRPPGLNFPATASSPPVLLYKIEPERSPKARKAGWKGVIRANLVIDEQGNVSDVKPLGAPPDLDMEAQVVEAARQWKFKPATKNGVRVSAVASIEFKFSESGFLK